MQDRRQNDDRSRSNRRPDRGGEPSSTQQGIRAQFQENGQIITVDVTGSLTRSDARLIGGIVADELHHPQAYSEQIREGNLTTSINLSAAFDGARTGQAIISSTTGPAHSGNFNVTMQPITP